MSGRAAGYCAGYGVPGYANPAFGWGYGMGFGRGRGSGGRGGGRGWRNMFYATGLTGWQRAAGYAAPYAPYAAAPDPKLEKQALQSQADALQSELELIKKRLTELESAASDA